MIMVPCHAQDEGVLTIKVLDEESDKPVRGAQVTVGSASGFTGVGGTVRLRIPASQEFELIIEASGYQPRRDSGLLHRGTSAGFGYYLTPLDSVIEPDFPSSLADQAANERTQEVARSKAPDNGKRVERKEDEEPKAWPIRIKDNTDYIGKAWLDPRYKAYFRIRFKGQTFKVALRTSGKEGENIAGNYSGTIDSNGVISGALNPNVKSEMWYGDASHAGTGGTMSGRVVMDRLYPRFTGTFTFSIAERTFKGEWRAKHYKASWENAK